jgi:hypothetical protein
MSTADTTAAAAGAAAAAAAAAPQASPSQSNATVATINNANNNVGGDSLVCQWTSCGERLPSPEQLYVSLTSTLSFIEVDDHRSGCQAIQLR